MKEATGKYNINNGQFIGNVTVEFNDYESASGNEILAKSKLKDAALKIHSLPSNTPIEIIIFSITDVNLTNENGDAINQNSNPESPNTVRQDSKIEPSIKVPEQTNTSAL